MAFKEHKYLKTRRFLNNSQGIGAMQCQVSRTSYGKDPEYGYVDADISISDCHRSIVLDFSMHDKKDAAQRLAKIDQLIVDMVKFQTALKQAADDFIKDKDKPVVKKKSTAKKPAVIKSKL
jgi:hypothetical protein